MVPNAFHEFFLAAAGAAAALVGLLFVAISVAVEPVAGPRAVVEQQVRAATALLALLSPLVLALIALLPDTDIGYASAAYGTLGLLFAAASLRRLLGAGQHLGLRIARQFAGFTAVMGLELFGGARLIVSPEETGGLYYVAGAMIGSLTIGIDRAWQLVGARQTGVGVSVRDLFGGSSAAAGGRGEDAGSERASSAGGSGA